MRVPITSKYKGIPTHVELQNDFLSTRSYIKTEDIRSISIKRFIKKLGMVDEGVILAVEERLKMLR
jgi:mRNA-degrading endonuclease toxin of MazEF toxin-antitoxin module